MIEGQATVLLVDDVATALAYYADKLGFSVEAWDRNPAHYGYARRDGCALHFACVDGASPRPNSVAAPPDMFDVYVYADDVDALHEELAGRGADVLDSPRHREYGMRDFRVRDPHGYILAFGKPAQPSTE